MFNLYRVYLISTQCEVCPWDSGKCVGGDAAARHWAWHVSPGRLAVMRDADGRAVAFDRYACVGADRPDVVESLTGHRMERPVV